MDIDNSKKRFVLGVLSIVFIALLLVFGLLDLLGFMKDTTCYPFLGCNAGFFGLDADAHFVSGLAEATSIIWLMTKYSRFNFLRVIAFVALIGTAWEVMEFSFDYLRMNIFHINLLDPLTLAQPSNSDTVGDQFLGLVSGILVAFIYNQIHKKPSV